MLDAPLIDCSIPGYCLVEQVYQVAGQVIYRAIRNQDQAPVLLKAIQVDSIAYSIIHQLRYEYEVSRKFSISGLAQVLNLEMSEQCPLLVLEDLGGYPLAHWIESTKFSLVEILQWTVKVVETLGQLHQQHIIHHSLDPNNILINPTTGTVQLINLGMNTGLPSVSGRWELASPFRHALMYCSPEQTGRLNRAVDYRTDFYSLGVTLYQVLAGQPPFQSQDPIELVHCHIARQPVPLHKQNPAIPLGLSAIVMKLLAKTVEDRYQSAYGLKADLKHCLEQLMQTGTIVEFPLAQHDRFTQFRFPQKRYGRDTELTSLLASFQRASQGQLEFVLVSGAAGVGKSFLVHELQRSILQKRGYFITGKFDEFRQDVPYLSLIQAFQELVRQILTESDAQVQQWREKLAQAIGNNSQILIDVIPEIAVLLDKTPSPPAKLDALESQNRFHRVLQQFLRIFAQKDHPLVIFLDDLQWADAASLTLVHRLLTELDQVSLLIIGAYRSQPIQGNHPLHLLASLPITQVLEVPPLHLPDTVQLLADSFGLSPESITPFAELLFNRTQGNPFFLNQLLEFLESAQLITYDYGQGGWQWNLNQIQNLGITQDVVDLMIDKIRRLPVVTQQLLKVAACIGNEFNLGLLSVVQGSSPTETAQGLWDAFREGLLLPANLGATRSLDWELWLLQEQPEGITFRFLHDRVQQAAYSLLLPTERQVFHLKVGQVCLRQMLSLRQDDQLFEVVNQLNAGRDLIRTPEERWQLAHLNLGAGKKAKSAAAYEPARKYFAMGIALLPPNSWENDYSLTFDLLSEQLECEYLCGNWQGADVAFSTLLTHARSDLERVEVYATQMVLYLSQNRRSEALELGRAGLSLLGEAIPAVIDRAVVAAEHNQLQQLLEDTLGDRDIAHLARLSRAQDAQNQVIMQVLQYLAAASVTRDRLFYQWVILRMVQRTLREGLTAHSAYGCVAYGTILSAAENYPTAHAFGQVALQMSEQFNSLQGITQFSFGGLLAHWQLSFLDCRRYLLRAFQQCCETGEFLYALYSLVLRADTTLMSGISLDKAEQDIQQSQEFATQRRSSTFINDAVIKQQFIRSLQGATQADGSFSGGEISETELLKQLQQPNEPQNTLSRYYIYKLQSLYLFEQYEEAHPIAQASAQLVDSHFGVAIAVEHYFYTALLLAARYPHGTESERSHIWQTLEAHCGQFQKWADHCPANYGHRFLLIQAEMAQLQGLDAEATTLYDRAILAANEQGCWAIEAIACEQAAKYHRRQHRSRMARSYFQDACAAYAQWGATAKVVKLRQDWQQLAGSEPRRDAETWLSDRLFPESPQQPWNARSTQTLDWMTVIKASQALSSEIVFSSLMEKLMKIVIENAGADRGLLVVRRDAELKIEAEGYVNAPSEGEDWETTISEGDRDHAGDLSQRMPLTLIAYVERTHTTIVLNHAALDDRFGGDPYIQAQQTKSVLCFPMVYQGKLTGILYLENHLTLGAFTPDRLAVLKLLTAQVAISIENASLYRNLQHYSQELELQNQALAQSRQQLQAQTEQLEEMLSNLKRTQAQLVQTEKLSSLGQLIAGVAHEIKNPLNFIAGNIDYADTYVQQLLQLIQLYQAHYPEPAPAIQTEIDTMDLEFVLDDLQKIFSSMQMGSERIHNLVFSLRNFSRTDEREVQSVDIHEGLEGTILILQPRLKATQERPAIQLEKHYGDLPLVECYPSQLNQVFMNLIANAIDAIDELCQHRTFEVNRTLPSVVRVDTEVIDPQHIAVRIRDNGAGMTEDTRQQLFAPFFTTKPTGQGTGLGLSISYQIVVEKHSGTLSCVSAINEGAEFTVIIPIYQPASAPLPRNATIDLRPS
ncbi:ATP-binding sensor histidine kinase [Alkalinema sp. FACHB-956]|uniref:trifunctional serine/threonine-protein kinase/ATP-binding protein/sensor histidine kinase n=1 Tax=Alkalinema sp. FACHB-956 TaxID=2692768 RepID=UPI0016857138|nr:ATP-binding sensor histidine kinase [Alkalinema sp. FACHB-956]MBD2326226.1 AAA family ATPase [Alkalinema sp. FACHB-956]